MKIPTMEISQGVAAVYAAVIGIMASAVASSIAAHAGRRQAQIGAQAQIKAAELQAEEAHRQEKNRRRQQVYSQFHQQSETVRASLVDAKSVIAGISVNATPSQLSRALEEAEQKEEIIGDSIRGLWFRYSEVLLEGPTEISDIAEEMNDSFVESAKFWGEWATLLLDAGLRDWEAAIRAAHRYSESEDVSSELTERFVSAAQQILR
ncbi:hypothetical protein [Streptomyces californicus]|uniref:hypothetical protein n=1 Tax=Streptomyces californicus TaxID=67351 RepID=UPI0033FE5503